MSERRTIQILNLNVGIHFVSEQLRDIGTNLKLLTYRRNCTTMNLRFHQPVDA